MACIVPAAAEAMASIIYGTPALRWEGPCPYQEPTIEAPVAAPAPASTTPPKAPTKRASNKRAAGNSTKTQASSSHDTTPPAATSSQAAPAATQGEDSESSSFIPLDIPFGTAEYTPTVKKFIPVAPKYGMTGSCKDTTDSCKDTTASSKIKKSNKFLYPYWNSEGDSCFRCACDKPMTRRRDVERHIANVHFGWRDPKFQCQHCGNYTLSKTALREHITARHDKQKPQVCTACHGRWATSAELSKHKPKCTVKPTALKKRLAPCGESGPEPDAKKARKTRSTAASLQSDESDNTDSSFDYSAGTTEISPATSYDTEFANDNGMFCGSGMQFYQPSSQGLPAPSQLQEVMMDQIQFGPSSYDFAQALPEPDYGMSAQMDPMALQPGLMLDNPAALMQPYDDGNLPLCMDPQLLALDATMPAFVTTTNADAPMFQGASTVDGELPTPSPNFVDPEGVPDLSLIADFLGMNQAPSNATTRPEVAPVDYQPLPFLVNEGFGLNNFASMTLPEFQDGDWHGDIGGNQEDGCIDEIVFVDGYRGMGW